MALNREQRREAKKEIQKIQKMEPAKFAVWLAAYQKASYEDGFGDGVESNTLAVMRSTYTMSLGLEIPASSA